MNQNILDALRLYCSEYDNEKDSIREVTDFIKTNPDCFCRDNLSGHITGSAWLLNPDENKVLLTYHKKLNKWLQLGGHSDGDSDTWHVALREATEESGILDISFVTQKIFDVDVHVIPADKNSGTLEHKHYDIRFLLKAPNENFTIGNESFALKWASLTDLENMLAEGKIAPGIQRMINKWRKILYGD